MWPSRMTVLPARGKMCFPFVYIVSHCPNKASLLVTCHIVFCLLKSDNICSLTWENRRCLAIYTDYLQSQENKCFCLKYPWIWEEQVNYNARRLLLVCSSNCLCSPALPKMAFHLMPFTTMGTFQILQGKTQLPHLSQWERHTIIIHWIFTCIFIYSMYFLFLWVLLQPFLPLILTYDC